jgi:glycosyltransferase involved in cell wall biosynthesis
MKKSILMVGLYPPHHIGGGEAQQYVLAHMLNERGYNVSVLSMGDKKNYEAYDEDGVKVYRIGKFQSDRRGFVSFFDALKYVTLEIFNPLIFFFTIYLIVKHRIHSVHIINYHQISLAPLIASKLLLRNIVVTMHAHELICSYSSMMPFCFGIRRDRCGECLLRYHKLPKKLKPLKITIGSISNLITSSILSIKLNMTNSLANKIVFPSFYSKNMHLKYGVDKRKAKVIHCFLNDFKEVEGKNNKKNNKKIILYVGKVMEEKGIEVLIRSVKKLLKYDKNWKLIVIGVGRALNEMKKLTHELGLDQYVEFLGHVQHHYIFKYYSIADVVVIPSTVPETFSIALLEAHLSKKITICSKTGALEERIKDGENGFLVEPNNSDELAKKIYFVLKNYAKLKFIEEKAYLNAKKLYSSEKSFSEYVKLLG